MENPSSTSSKIHFLESGGNNSNIAFFCPPEIPIFHLIKAFHMAERCSDCGLCEEACPEDAIFMGKEFELASYHRDDFIYSKERLLMPLREAAKQRPELLQPGTGLSMGQHYEPIAPGVGLRP